MLSKFTKPTNQSNKIKLESKILYCTWSYGRAWAGTKSSFDVKTVFVGNGANIKIKLKNNSGKTLQKKEGKIYKNIYKGEIDIPDKFKIGDMIYLETELPKHGVFCESNLIPIMPQIKIKNMGWDKKEIYNGEEVKIFAKFLDMPDNIPLKIHIFEYDSYGYHDPIAVIQTEINNNSFEVLWKFNYPGNVTKIPTAVKLKPYKREYQQPKFFFILNIDGVKIGTSYESGFLTFCDPIIVKLLDGLGNPIKNKEVIIHLPDGTEEETKSDENGIVKSKKDMPGKSYIEIK